MNEPEVKAWIERERARRKVKKSSFDLLYILKDIVHAQESRERPDENESDDPLNDSQLWQRAREAIWKATGK
jgi:hypothetical protein